MDMVLKPQDVVVLLKLVAWGRESWSYQELAELLGMSAGEVHVGLNRAFAAGLAELQGRGQRGHLRAVLPQEGHG
jgi:DNA-directed RNA polymerase specialized sigma24 family protein